MMNEPIIMIGPMKAGKTTVGKLLAEQLDLPHISLDRFEKQYTEPVGYDDTLAQKLQAEEGDLAWYSYRRTFFDTAVTSFLAEHTKGVLDLGGGHPILPDAAKQARVNEALAPYRNVVLLLPTADLQESIQILKPRQRPEYLNPDLNEIFLADHRFVQMAKYVFYTEGKTPEETCIEIIQTLDSE